MKYSQYIRNKIVNRFTWNGIQIVQKDKLSNDDISLKTVLDSVKSSVPSRFLKNIDNIYIGNFDFLKEKDVHASYQDGSIFLTNNSLSEDAMGSDIIHEIAHSIEYSYRDLLYGDGKLEEEFLNKRKSLWLRLKDENFSKDLNFFLEPEYNEKFDAFLYEDVGYPLLSILTVNIFYSPYASTSLREYYANGFEAFFFLKDVNRIKKISPILFDKLNNLLYNNEYEYEY